MKRSIRIAIRGEKALHLKIKNVESKHDPKLGYEHSLTTPLQVSSYTTMKGHALIYTPHPFISQSRNFRQP